MRRDYTPGEPQGLTTPPKRLSLGAMIGLGLSAVAMLAMANTARSLWRS